MNSYCCRTRIEEAKSEENGEKERRRENASVGEGRRETEIERKRRKK